MNKHTSQQIRALISELEKSGLSNNNIAKQLNISKATVSRYTKPKQPKQHTKETIEKCVDLYQKGWTQKEVSIKMGVSVACVNRWLKSYKIPIVRTVRPKNKTKTIPKPEKIKKADPAIRFIKKVRSEEKQLPLLKSLPAIKSQTRKVRINAKLEVWAKDNETDAEVISRWNRRLKKKI